MRNAKIRPLTRFDRYGNRANEIRLFLCVFVRPGRKSPPECGNRDSMFEFIRSHRRWMQFILLLLIVPSFFLVGIQGYESFMRKEPELATVAGQPISRAEFDQAHRNQLEQYRQRLGAQFDPAVIDTPQLRDCLLYTSRCV